MRPRAPLSASLKHPNGRFARAPSCATLPSLALLSSLAPLAPRAAAQNIARPYGNVVYSQVSRHRDTGLSRGYGFVSYETVEEADKAIAGIHGTVVQGRALRVEKVKADEDQQRGR
jgi:hypothetical protein